MLKRESKVIGDTEYQTTQLDAVTARRVFLRMAKLLAPMAAELGDGKKGVESERLFRGLATAIRSATEEDLDYFCDQFAKVTDVVIVDEKGNRKSPRLSTVMALHFVGDRFGDLFDWLLFCLEVNFGSFFGKLGVTLGTSGEQTTELK
jgi:hypothetical protein